LSHYLLCTSFAFRLYVLTKENLNKMGVCITLVCVNGINFLVIIVMFHEFTHTNTDSFIQFTDGRIPTEVLNLTIGILDSSTRLTTQATGMYVASASPIVFACCFIMQRRIMSFLRDNNVCPLRGRTISSFIIYFKALRSLLIISFIASMGSSLLLLSVFEILRSPFLDFLQPAINCSVLIVSILVNLTYVKPYSE
ncbi:hypothetical protein PENTCL1PPCAC_30200, partial [Pristionchus entomophagus]